MMIERMGGRKNAEPFLSVHCCTVPHSTFHHIILQVVCDYYCIVIS